MVSMSFKPDCVMSKCYVKGKCCSSLFRFFYFCNQKIMASQKLVLIIKICDAVNIYNDQQYLHDSIIVWHGCILLFFTKLLSDIIAKRGDIFGFSHVIILKKVETPSAH
jgi:hypothetical protein